MADVAHVYRVHAVVSGATSSPSPMDYATTAVTLFIDDPLAAGTMIKGMHISQLRKAVDAVRIAAGLTAYGMRPDGSGWAGYDPPAGTVTAAAVNDVRGALAEARLRLGRPALVYTSPLPASGSLVRTFHLQEIRSGVK